jgi:hypothetical protein
MPRLFASGVVAAALIGFIAPVHASDATYDKLTYLTFTAPVQIPGATLRAGTYRFHLTNPETTRNVLQVLSDDGATVYAMFHTIPDSRMSLTEESMVTFRETPVGVPPAVKSLFYGGEYRGYEFVYPEGGPNLVADVAPLPEITYTPMPAAPTPAPVAEAVPTPTAPVLEAAEPAPPMPEPAELPRTASPLPLVATGGAALLLLGFAIGLALRRHAN